MKPLLLLFLLALLAVNVFATCCNQKKEPSIITRTFKTGHLDIVIKSNKISLNIRKSDGPNVEYYLYTKSSKITKDEPFGIEQDCEELTTCINSGNRTHAWIKANPDSEIIQVRRVLDDEDGQISDCFNVGNGAEWYGGPELRHQHWPIQNTYYEEVAYVPRHQESMALTERYWLSSKGIYVFVDERDPLFLDQSNFKDRHMCLVAKNKPPYRRRANVTLAYEIGVFADPRAAHESAIARHFDKPVDHPDERMITHPIWSTWARYKVRVNDSLVRELADEIVAHGFNNSQIEIDDRWETCYGSALFDPDKFPDVEALTTDLHQMGFRVSLWIHPFFNVGCNDGEGYNFSLKNGYLVKSEQGSVQTSWWQGTLAAALDFTNPEAVEWWLGRLDKLKALGIDSFKFDAGETSWLPQVPDLTGPLDLQPGIYTYNYTSILASRFNRSIEVRVGWRSQGLPVFVRMIDKDTKWTWNNGLPTLITTLLQMNLNGYVYVLPDMIGGNGYADDPFDTSELPSKDLFVRWLQANVFMPAMQYSFVPWDFDDETIAICKNYTDLHAEIAPKIIEYMKKSMKTGAPLNAPIWWVDPTNLDAHKINDEYLLGEDILVAPVIEENALTRNVYLPTGIWKDANTGKVYAGPMWLDDYPAPLNILPYFHKN